MGRPRKSNLEKFLDGNPGKRNPLQPGVSGDVGLPPMPTTLSENAKRHWQRLAPKLNQSGICKKLDMTMFTILVETLADLDQATAQLRAEGLTITDSKGRLVRNPLSVAVKDLRTQVSQLSIQFGLTPKSRNTFASIEVADKPNEDTELADMLGGGSES